MAQGEAGELTISVGGAEIAGWETIDVTLRAEGFPPSFEIAMSSKLPIASKTTIAKAGDACVVKIGSDTVITGYIDRDTNAADANGHSLTLVGRGKTQDLVDCSAQWDSGQIMSATALDTATKLARPYGITVGLAEGASAGPKAAQLNITFGETSADIIQRLARNAGLLAYEDAKGELKLARVGATKAASGIKFGENVLAYSVTNSMDERYSEMRCVMSPYYTIGDVHGTGGFDSFVIDTESDPNVPRPRLLYMVMENIAGDYREFNKLRTKWEVARRAGRAATANASIDSWRDSAGKLWAPNTRIDVDLPGLRHTGDMCISEVHFHRSSERGTVADIFVLPPEAFAPEPISLQPVSTAGLVTGPGEPQ